jgi:hypothetical protein
MINKKTIQETIILTASYYRQVMDPAVLDMYAEDLIDLPLSEVIEAYRTYRRDPKNRTMPLPAHIRAIVQPIRTIESTARDGASRIQQAIVRYGYSNESEARKFLGEKTWSVVRSFGGWNYICSNHGITIDPGVFYAQARERLNDEHTYSSHDVISLQAPDEEKLEQTNFNQDRFNQLKEILNIKGG